MTVDVSPIIEKAKQQCSEQGVKLTAKREQVLTTIISAKEALSPYELAELYRDEFGQAIPAMSVYRILDFLAELSLVHKLNSANKYIACSHISCSHSHQMPQFLICENCHKVKEIGLKQQLIDELASSVQQTGFKLTTSQLELSGLCEDCQTQCEE
jgi:Fur family zinc uptake transcriptional regulator